MLSPPEWVAQSLGKHNEVDRAQVVRSNCVEIQRKRGYPTVTVRVVDTRVEASDLSRIGLDDVDAIVTTRKDGAYSWDAKTEALDRGKDLYSNREFWRALGNKKFVGSESSDIEYFVERVRAHDKVIELERLSPRLFRVRRTSGLDTLLVYCADEYILSEDHVRRVLEACPEAQVITNLSSWNKITPEAAEEARRRGCRVFDLSGIYGALNRNAAAIRDI